MYGVRASGPATRKTVDMKSGGLAVAALLLGNIALAMGPWLVRLSAIGPEASAFWRIMLALPFLFVATRLSSQPLPRERRSWLLLVIGGLFFAADLIAWHNGIVITRLANATLFGNVGSFLFAAYGFIVVRKLPETRQWISILLALAGVTLLLGRSYDLDPRYVIGDLLCVLAGCFYGGYLIVVDKARGTLGSWPVLAIVSASAVIPLFLLAIASGPIVPPDWIPVVLLALGSQVIGQGLLVYAVGHLSPMMVGIGLLTQPALSAVIGSAFYRERLGLRDLAGMIAIGAALVLIRAGKTDR